MAQNYWESENLFQPDIYFLVHKSFFKFKKISQNRKSLTKSRKVFWNRKKKLLSQRTLESVVGKLVTKTTGHVPYVGLLKCTMHQLTRLKAFHCHIFISLRFCDVLGILVGLAQEKVKLRVWLGKFFLITCHWEVFVRTRHILYQFLVRVEKNIILRCWEELVMIRMLFDRGCEGLLWAEVLTDLQGNFTPSHHT